MILRCSSAFHNQPKGPRTSTIGGEIGARGTYLKFKFWPQRPSSEEEKSQNLNLRCVPLAATFSGGHPTLSLIEKAPLVAFSAVTERRILESAWLTGNSPSGHLVSLAAFKPSPSRMQNLDPIQIQALYEQEQVPQ
jgi:hypothetical protein